MTRRGFFGAIAAAIAAPAGRPSSIRPICGPLWFEARRRREAEIIADLVRRHPELIPSLGEVLQP